MSGKTPATTRRGNLPSASRYQCANKARRKDRAIRARFLRPETLITKPRETQRQHQKRRGITYREAVRNVPGQNLTAAADVIAEAVSVKTDPLAPLSMRLIKNAARGGCAASYLSSFHRRLPVIDGEDSCTRWRQKPGWREHGENIPQAYLKQAEKEFKQVLRQAAGTGAETQPGKRMNARQEKSLLKTS